MNDTANRGAPRRRRRFRVIDLAVAIAAAIAILIGLGALSSAEQGIVVERTGVGTTPVTVRHPFDDAPAPVVVIGHGFAGSRQLMQPFAVTLARNGYVAVTFDFPGHGANPTPLEGEIGTPERTQILLDALSQVIEFSRGLPRSDGQLALVGHSMAGDIAIRYASGAPTPDAPEGGDPAASTAPRTEISAIVAVSPYLSTDVGDPRSAPAPHNVLFVYGEWEPDMILAQGREAIANVAKMAAEDIEPGVTYGEMENGSARRFVVAEGVEHIGVLYSATSLEAALDWLNRVFDRASTGWVDARGPWLGLYFLGALLLAWPLSRLLPAVSARPLGAGLGWRRLLPIALLPALLTPLLLRPVPSDFLPIAIGDYVALHFGLYGLLTGVGLWLLGTHRARPTGFAVAWPAFIGAVVAVICYQTLAVAIPTELFVAKFLPEPHRFLILIVLFCGTLMWFVTDEWLTRGENAARGGYMLTKALFLLSLMLAVALNLEELFFLVIIIPAILVLFVVYGLFSRWIYRQTHHPLVAAIANALAFAAAITVSFPIAD